ncbi:MAG TPA: DUF1800 domain-containing protein [Candidatus Saccharimonadales bacterium]|jgi:uncharacterized protein (DUF1800 family)|nr:DUF1800 domain-containing protein [Candidatus Saccharimonadales bacterium]
MRTTRKPIPWVIAVILFSAFVLLAADKKSKSAGPPSMDEDKKIQHALNRFSFGARPGDIERVRSMGLEKWFEEQLHPEKIDDSGVEARLAPLRTLRMSTREMVDNFPPPQVVKALQAGRVSMPSDPAKRAIYESRLEAYEQRQNNKEKKQGQGADDAELIMKPDPAMKMDPQADGEMSAEKQSDRQKQLESQMYADVDAAKLLELPPEQRYQKIIKMAPEDRMIMARSVRGPQGQQLIEGMKPEQRETIQAIVNPQLVIGGELAQAKVLRAVYSERQLDEVMADFWLNHFNIFIGKGPDRYMLNAYERDVIRPHALGKFKDLLVATAKSPAMLFYLDNWQSVGPKSELAIDGPQRRRPNLGFKGPFDRQMRPGNQKPPQQQNRPSGLNENYAREIMELHTLGVDGGYTQKDVTELAKVLTGWSIQQPQRGGDFIFNDRAHEPGVKNVLGHKIKDHGEGEAMEMFDILAHHPATARFISKKIAMRFVSDNPPQALIDRMADTFLNKDGDIREVLRTLFRSPELWAAEAYRAKVKTPLEFVVSAVRASGVEVQNAMPLVQNLNRMGMPLYGMQPPTGYSMKAETWVNSSALINRMNFALALGNGRLPGMSADPQGILHGAAPKDLEGALTAMETAILAGEVSGQTHTVLQKQLNDPQITRRKLDDPEKAPNYGLIAGLIMGSPEFQRR